MMTSADLTHFCGEDPGKSSTRLTKSWLRHGAACLVNSTLSNEEGDSGASANFITVIT